MMDPDAVIHITTTDPTPPYAQLRRQIMELILSGRLEPGQRLPPVRQLASDLGLAAGTVARSYRELEAQGLVDTRRGGGTRVTHDAPHDTTPSATDLQERMTTLVRYARRLGASDQQIRDAVDAAIDATDGVHAEPRTEG